jgi:hypothetical protein
MSMSDTTESLLLRRALSRARPEDYVNWAVEQLCRGADSPSLRILAGLSVRFDRDEVEVYFRLSCGELGLVDVDEATPPLEVARMVQRAYAERRVSPDEAVERRRPAWSRAVCEQCGSGQLTSLGNPDARAAFLDEMESSAV